MLEIDDAVGEAYYCQIEGLRKGRAGHDPQPCILRAGVFLESNQPVLRCLDASGRPAIVAILSHAQAEELGEALLRAARVKS